MGGCYDRVQGMAILHRRDTRHCGSMPLSTMGPPAANTLHVDSPDGLAALEHFAASGRLEWKALGDWKDYSDFSARGTKQDLAVIGLAHALDAGGNSLMALILSAATGSSPPRTSSGNSPLRNSACSRPSPPTTPCSTKAVPATTSPQLGFLGCAWLGDGYQWEVFARYDLIKFDDDFRPDTEEDTFHEITTGVTRFPGNDGSAGQCQDHRRFRHHPMALPSGPTTSVSPSPPTRTPSMSAPSCSW